MRLLILLSILAFSFAQTLLLETSPIPSKINAMDLVEGIFDGLHLGRIAPSIEKCLKSSTDLVKGLIDFAHACQEKRGTFYLVNNFTYALKSLPSSCRGCVDVPDEAWKRLEEIYMKPFNYSFSKYIKAVLLNVPYRLDELVIHYRDIKKAFEENDYYAAGYNIGEIPNIIFNVTKPDPIPDPVDEPRFLEEVTAIDWNKVHKNFKAVLTHLLTFFHSTKLVNETTFNNVNESVMLSELHIYNAIMEFAKPNIKEGVLQLIDITGHLNQLVNGVYFSVKQVANKVLNDTIFAHKDYITLNLIQHSGYFIYNIYKVVLAFGAKNYFEVTKRFTIILRKIIYFDKDVLDDINTKFILNK